MKKTIIFCLLFLSAYSTYAQRHGLLSSLSAGESSVMIGGGLSKLSGDIGGDNFKSLLKNDLGYTYSLTYRYILPSKIGFGIYVDYSKYQGEDALQFNGDRGYHFHSNAASAGGRIDYLLVGNPFSENAYKHSVYLFGGGNATSANSVLNDSIKGSSVTPAVFVGGGYQFRFIKNVSLGIEINEIFFLSDKLDGYFPNVSGNKNNDAAFHLKLTVSYIFPLDKRKIDYNERWER